MKIASWNIRGCNDPLKTQEVLGFIRSESLDVLGLLETRIRKNKADGIMRTLFSSYSVVANYDYQVNGRIWVVWNPATVALIPLQVHSQFVHCHIHHHSSNVEFLATFVYGNNDPSVRLSLWDSLSSLSQSSMDWIVLGDFNIVRDNSEWISDHPPKLSDILDFNACILHCGLDDIHNTGCEFSWTNKQDGSTVWSKLDRALINSAWLTHFPSSAAKVLPSGVSDHSPIMVSIIDEVRPRRRFSFLNYWVDDPTYHARVCKAWSVSVKGSTMF
ncbi:hypothetical protein RND81_11G032700 [Saponaria officinalis]|uniref:Endonuclease/exonuclease/phosphatase domain-containing protein n=1 Tax=Saponaria officinalis TaxID=3572 RepID=A0AAW1HH96_SAPOF